MVGAMARGAGRWWGIGVALVQGEEILRIGWCPGVKRWWLPGEWVHARGKGKGAVDKTVRRSRRGVGVRNG